MQWPRASIGGKTADSLMPAKQNRLRRIRAADLIAGLQLLSALSKNTLYAATAPTARDTANGTGHHFIDEKLDVRAATCGTLSNTGEADIGSPLAQVKTPKDAADDFTAACHSALPAISRAVHAGFEFIFFADVISTH